MEDFINLIDKFVESVLKVTEIGSVKMFENSSPEFIETRVEIILLWFMSSILLIVVS